MAAAARRTATAACRWSAAPPGLAMGIGRRALGRFRGIVKGHYNGVGARVIFSMVRGRDGGLGPM